MKVAASAVHNKSTTVMVGWNSKGTNDGGWRGWDDGCNISGLGLGFDRNERVIYPALIQL